ncbi:MAG: hypothetical protein AB1437_06630 [Pseudomonadota bacterium]
MRKKPVIAALLLAGVLAAVLVQQRHAGAPPAATTMPAAPSQAPAHVAALAQQTDDAPEAEVTQSLKGLDFSLRVTVNGNDSYRDLGITMDDGTPIRLIRPLGGEAGELAHMTFAPGETFELVRLIPGEAREQIVSKGEQLLNRGEGILGTYTLYRIHEGQLKEIFSVITKREREEGNGPPPQRLEARLEQTTRDGAPAFAYHVKAGEQAERTIVFVWNGRHFEDPSGEYARIDEEFSP